jgi:arylsulfatase A-like enzyme
VLLEHHAEHGRPGPAAGDDERERRPLGHGRQRHRGLGTWIAVRLSTPPLLHSPDVGDGDRPNVLLVVLDTARADHFGALGGKHHTPGFDSVADRGQASVAISTSPWTVPSHASMFTGLLPFDHGATGAAAIMPDRRLASLRPAIEAHRDRWLPAVLRTAGYRTMGISSNVWITREMGFDVGFEEFHAVGMARVTPRAAEPDHHWRLRDVAPEGLRRRAKRAARYLHDARKGRDFGSREAERVVREFAAGDEGGRPWFLFVNVMEAHAPYLPPPGFGELAPRDRLRGPAVNHRYLGDVFVAAYNVGATDELVKEDLRLLRRLYAAEIEYADTFLTGALEALEAQLDRTLVIVTADHGENLGEDHRLGHVAALDDRLVRVPLAAAGPDAPALNSRVTSLGALPAAIATAAGIADHPYGRVESGDIAMAQYESAWHHLRRAAEAARRYPLTDRQQQALRAPAMLATDGRIWVARTGSEERVWATVEAQQAPGEQTRSEALNVPPHLGAALDRVGAEPPVRGAGAAVSPEEEAEIESRLHELGYL